MGIWTDQARKSGRLVSVDDDFAFPDSNHLPEIELVVRKVPENIEVKAVFFVIPRVGDMIYLSIPGHEGSDEFKVKSVAYECSEQLSAWIMNRIVVNVETV